MATTRSDASVHVQALPGHVASITTMYPRAVEIEDLGPGLLDGEKHARACC